MGRAFLPANLLIKPAWRADKSVRPTLTLKQLADKNVRPTLTRKQLADKNVRHTLARKQRRTRVSAPH